MVKNSRFLADLVSVSDADAAREFWRSQKLRYDNGGHIVYAFITGPQREIMGCSDDGEPSGTAGRPTLEVLKGSGLTNVILTTARWFGGTKLGTGGLVRAYTEIAQSVAALAQSTELVAMRRVALQCPYNCYELLRRQLDALEFEVVSEEFASDVAVTGRVRLEKCAELEKIAAELSNGRIIPVFSEEP